MGLQFAEFWKLAIESRLFTADQGRQLVGLYVEEHGGKLDSDAVRVAKWLVARGALTRFQAKVLLAGRPGPFVYGDYQVCDRLDAGRLAGLFRAHHQATKHPVCLHFLTGPGLQDPRALARLGPQLAIARAVCRGQVHLSQCYHLVEIERYKFVVIEDLRGESVEEQLAARGKLPPGEACRIVREAALGLSRLHEAGHAHGHVRPSNVWLDEQGRAKTLQFPLSHDPLAPPDEAAAADADFLAPERSQGGRLPDPAADVYSLGCMLYHLLSGLMPYPGGDARQKAARHASGTPRPIEQVNPMVPSALAKALTYMLQKNREQRYPQAAAVAEVLAPYAEGSVAGEQGAAATAAVYERWLDQTVRLAAPAAPPIAVAAPMPAAAPVAAAAPETTRGAPAARPLQAAPVWPAAAVPTAAPLAPMGRPVVAVASGQAPVPVAVAEAPSFSAGSHSPAATARGNRSAMPMVLTVVAVIGMLALGGVAIVMLSNSPSGVQPGPNHGEVAGSSAPPHTASAVVESAPPPNELPRAAKEPMESVASLDEPIWQSPTAGKPLNVAYLAAGAQAIAALRPADLIENPEWEKLSDPRTLGTLAEWLQALPKLAGTGLKNMELVLVGLLDASPEPPRVTLVVHTLEPLSKAELLEAWGNPRAEEVDGATIFVQGHRAFFFPTQEEIKTLAVAPPEEMREIVKLGDEPPPLRREIEALLESSDEQRHFTLVFAPNFPFTGGKSLFSEQGARLQKPLDDFLEMEDKQDHFDLPRAALLSAHLGEALFIELRIVDTFEGRPAAAVAKEYRERVGRLPREVSQYVRDLFLSDYSKPVLWDFRDQLEVLDKYTRAGTQGKQAVLRAYLPAVAAHNLALGSHLALLENTGAGPSRVAATQAAAPPTVADKLKKKTSLSFPRNTLEASLKLLGDDIGVEIIILGTDLQQEGITKNQSFGLDERDQPAGEILRKIMKLANPDGKLVYTIKPKEGGGEEVLYVTTRAAVANRGDKLPPELEEKK